MDRQLFGHHLTSHEGEPGVLKERPWRHKLNIKTLLKDQSRLKTQCLTTDNIHNPKDIYSSLKYSDSHFKYNVIEALNQHKNNHFLFFFSFITHQTNKWHLILRPWSPLSYNSHASPGTWAVICLPKPCPATRDVTTKWQSDWWKPLTGVVGWARDGPTAEESRAMWSPKRHTPRKQEANNRGEELQSVQNSHVIDDTITIYHDRLQDQNLFCSVHEHK